MNLGGQSVLGALLLTVLGACSSSDDKSGTNGEPPTPEAGAGSGGATAMPPAVPACAASSTPVKGIDQAPTGFEWCGGTLFHRPEKKTCATRLPRTLPCGPAPGSGPSAGFCATDADCTTKPNGFCSTNAKSSTCYCDYGCNADEDCGAGFVCQCGDPNGKCVAATCSTDADCPGSLCLSASNGLCGQTFACATSADECKGPADCTPPVSDCVLGKNGHRTCQTPINCP